MSSSPPAPALLAEVTRRDVTTGDAVVESRHHGHLVITGPDGSVVASIGDPRRPTFHRSALKPFQATACLELLGQDAVALSDAEVAVSWASHRAEPRHLEAVRSLLRRSATPAEGLTCPPAPGEATPGASPTRVAHNCSGKHALFALAGAASGVHGADLLDPAGSFQRSLLAATTDACGEALAIGIDGCGAPAVSTPLVGLARGFAGVAEGGRWQRVRDAGLAHPALVGGEGRLESALLEAGVVAKVGAEGVYGVGFPLRGAWWGMAAKSEDGETRGAAALVTAVLVALDVIETATWSPPAVLGGGVPQGAVVAAATALTGLLEAVLTA